MIVENFFFVLKNSHWWNGKYMIQAAQAFWRLNPVFLRSSFAPLDRSDQTISQSFSSYQTIARPRALWSDRSATQEIVWP